MLKNINAGSVALIGILASIFSLVLSIFIFVSDYFVEYLPDTGARFVLGFVVFSLMLMIGALVLYQASLSREIASAEYQAKQVSQNMKLIAEITRIFHNLAHECRDQLFVFSLMQKAMVGGKEETIHVARIQRSYKMFNIFFLDNAKRIFDLLTGNNCACCIKILDEEEESGEYLVSTYFRDSISYAGRSHADVSTSAFSAELNSAFETIMFGDDTQHFFASNNLTEESQYVNCNKHWRDHYNAALVVPIRVRGPNSEYNYFGFFCVDNMEGGFDVKNCLNIANALADMYFNIMYFLDLTGVDVEIDPSDERSDTRGIGNL